MKHTVAHLRSTLQRIYQNMKNAEILASKNIVSVHPLQKESSINLIHYLALRREDLRPLQGLLHDTGLSSLASSESHILHQVQAVLTRLGAHFPSSEISAGTATAGMKLLHKRATTLFGSKENQYIPHLMVTFDTALAYNYETVNSLLKAGMNIARINCAHDSPDEWRGMINNVRQASIDFGRPCKIYMDLAGPKIRTMLYGRGRHKGRMKLKEQEQVFLAESDAFYDKTEKVIGCTLPGVVKDLRPGDRVLFDDGLFEAIVEIPGERIATLRISRISALKHELKPEKGINFPDTLLTVQSLTDYDKKVLPFAQENADLLGFSFVHTAADVKALQELIRHNGGKKIPIILKIETLDPHFRISCIAAVAIAQKNDISFAL